ncbi:MAG TPA: chromosome segregation protein ScpA, partial [Megasphaera sp.]|nr:chromosome segregation protein ScpA [Megasphaera sp.]
LMESRERTPMPFEKQFSGHIDKKALYAAFQAVYEALPGKKTVEIHLQQEIYSVSECMQRVEYVLHQALRPVPVRRIFQSCRTRTELIVVFLAVLELLKIGRCCTLSEGEDGNAASLRYIPHGAS